MKFDLHTHTFYSDGADSPEKMVRWAKKIGLDGIAITDHNTIGGWKRAIDEGKRVGLNVILGKEIKVKREKKGKTLGELIALFIEEDVSSNFCKPDEIGDVIDKVKAQDGLIGVAHPFRVLRSFLSPFKKNVKKSRVLEIIEEKNLEINCIEAVNGRSEEIENSLSLKYSVEKNLPKIAGSDAHWVHEIGGCYVEFNGEVDELKKKIMKSEVKIINKQKGPLEIIYHRISAKLIHEVYNFSANL